MERYPTRDEISGALTRLRARRVLAQEAVRRRPGWYMPTDQLLEVHPLDVVLNKIRDWFDEREAYLYSFIRDGHLSGIADPSADQDRALGPVQAEGALAAHAAKQRFEGGVAAPESMAQEVGR